MGDFQLSDDSELSLNKMAIKIIRSGVFGDSEVYFSDVVEWLREVYQMGFEEGKRYACAFHQRVDSPLPSKFTADIVHNPRMSGDKELLYKRDKETGKFSQVKG